MGVVMLRVLAQYRGEVAGSGDKVAGLLGDPGSGGVGGDPGEVHAAMVVRDRDENVRAASTKPREAP